MTSVDTLLEKPADWMSASGPDADLAPFTRCRLARNLADFPFPSQCTLDEKRAIEERISGVIESMNLLATGGYFALGDSDLREKRFLVERGMAGRALLEAEGPCGVYIADDQGLSISVNEENHLTLTGIASGVQFHEVWSRLNLIDDMLAGALDYAFSPRLGYLTASLRDVGTGLRAGALFHLPGVSVAGLVPSITTEVASRRHTLEPFTDAAGTPLDDFYLLTNASTLGRSEEEALFHLKHVATHVITQEREARGRIRSAAPLQMEDRIGRALGIARHARLLATAEANSLLSSLRLGVSAGLLDQFSLPQINDVFIASQNAHLETKSGRGCDELQFSVERADLFRARFAQN
jgi:protein arginine kinase